MDLLKKGFLDVIKAVKKNKLLFILLIFIQILFIVSVSFVGIKYQIKIYENVKGVIEPLESMDYDKYNMENPESWEQPLMKEMMQKMVSVTKDYEEMVKNILKMFFLILGCFLVLNGLDWSIANYMIKKDSITKYWGKFILISLVFLVPISLSGYLILKSFIGIKPESFKLGVKVMSWIFLVVGYFMLIGFCLIGEKLKGLFKKIFLIGIKKAHWTILSLLCVSFLIGLSLVLLYFLRNGVLMILGWSMLVVVLVLGKLFLIRVVGEIK